MNQAPATAARQFLEGLLQLAGAVEAVLERSLEPCGLSLAKMGALRILAEGEGPVPLGQLACRLRCVKSNVTQLIDRLEGEGLVRRSPDPEDRRSVLAVITPAGRQRLQQAADVRERAEEALLAELDPGQVERLTGLLQRVSARAARLR